MNKKLVLGVDIGGSKINIIVWDGKKIIDRWQSKEVNLAKIKAGISRFNISRVGIGLAGVLYYKTGQILDSPNLRWLEGLVLKKLLKKNIRFDNDVNCFLSAEVNLGAARNFKHILGVAMGTGIGGSIITNNKPLSGKNGSAGEFGAMILADGKSWEQLYQNSKGRSSYQAHLHALAFANLINIFDPEIIVLGGGGASLPQLTVMKKLLISPLAKKTKIVKANLGLDAVAIGAALLWAPEYKNEK
jgi:predicted NBD/HSP70 family sugar kinase